LKKTLPLKNQQYSVESQKGFFSSKEQLFALHCQLNNKIQYNQSIQYHQKRQKKNFLIFFVFETVGPRRFLFGLKIPNTKQGRKLANTLH
jgi:hypothetical protein